MAERDFDEFYAGNYGRLVVQVYAVTGNLADAEDAVQEAFARASVRWGRVGGYNSPEGWVRRVALNLAFTGLRRGRRLLEVLSRAPAPPQVPPLPADSLALVEALKALPLGFRQVLVLHYLADLPVRAVRWGRLYVLFTNGPTRYAATGRWHVFTYQVDAVRRTAIVPDYSGPSPPPDPPPLRGASPRTAAGIGFGSTLAELRRAYGRRLQVSMGEPGMVYRFRVGFGAAGELSGSLSGGTPSATITFLAAGARCGE